MPVSQLIRSRTFDTRCESPQHDVFLQKYSIRLFDSSVSSSNLNKRETERPCALAVETFRDSADSITPGFAIKVLAYYQKVAELDCAILFRNRLFFRCFVACQLVWQEPVFEWLEDHLYHVLHLPLRFGLLRRPKRRGRWKAGIQASC